MRMAVRFEPGFPLVARACYVAIDWGAFQEQNMSGLSRRAFVSTALVLAVCGTARAQQHAMASSGPRIALKGYDPVSYFTDGKPEPGSKEFTYAFDDTTYWFK